MRAGLTQSAEGQKRTNRQRTVDCALFPTMHQDIHVLLPLVLLFLVSLNSD